MSPRWAVLVAVGLLGCGEPQVADDALAAPSGPAAPTGDPLLLRAQSSFENGHIAPEIEAELLASPDPAHQRARRILETMDRQARGIAPAPSEKKTTTAKDATPTKAPTIRAPDPGSPTPGVPKQSGSTSSGGGTGGSGEGSNSPKARLAMLTRLRLSGGGSKVTLSLNAADRVVMGMAEQPASGIVRLVVESAGALPSFLQARPTLEGVKVIDVRRGEDTVQISVELAPGWKPRGPRSGATGASIDFVHEG